MRIEIMRKNRTFWLFGILLFLSLGFSVTNEQVWAKDNFDQEPSQLKRGNLIPIKSGNLGKIRTSDELGNYVKKDGSSWDYYQDGDDYVLQFHAGYIGDMGYYRIRDIKFSDDPNQLTKIILDPGVHFAADCVGLFADLKNLREIVGIENIDMPSLGATIDMFRNCESLTKLDLSNFDTKYDGRMDHMFDGCTNLRSLDLSKFDTTKMYYDPNEFDEDYGNSNMFGMFKGCVNLNHLVLGPKTLLYMKNVHLPQVPAPGNLVPGSNQVITSSNWIATKGSDQGKRFTSSELMLLQSRDQVTTYDWDTQAVVDKSTEAKAVTRTINLHQPDDSIKTDKQTVTIKRKVQFNPDGSKTYGPWSKATWDQYQVPSIVGYEPSQAVIPAKTIVDDQIQDTTIDIFYEPVELTTIIQYVDGDKIVSTKKVVGYIGDTINYRAPKGYEIVDDPQPTITGPNQVVTVHVEAKIVQSTQSKSLVRTINLHRPNGFFQSYDQVAVINRNVYTNQVTGEVSYGDWDQGKWDHYQVPAIAGYHPSQNVLAQIVNFETPNTVIDIYYLKN